ncbi:MAG TPA: HAMP domain-containing sensor histidine kinase [Mobilitalea sp.]|nr:HAMP domain-containing sensor histidine kinase [Mobilitalea sp.]
MIKKLQRKFIMITMGSLLLVMLILISAINAINLYQINSSINESLTFLSVNQGKFPSMDKNKPPKDENQIFGSHMNEETPFQTRYFVVEYYSDGTTKQIDTGHIAAVTSTVAEEYGDKVINGNKETGYLGIYKYKIVVQQNGSMVIFIDCRDKLQTATEFLTISCLVALATLILMFLLLSILSRKAIKPFVENAEKQKLFITDAGHEIKTPLAIISANADVLELMGGENEWITSIRNQTARLDKLVKNLLMLSKMDEESVKLIFKEFDYSETVAKMAGPFIAVAESKNKKFYMNIQPDIKIYGDENSIEQLVSTLVDNAMKYSSEEGTIKITLSATKKGKKLEVYNTTQDLDVANLDKLFDRFYRADSSRSRETGGYGIGLSIAKSIVEAHHGRISARSEDGNSICFTVML